MAGDVLLTNKGGGGCFTHNGKFVSDDAVTVGNCAVTNTGTIEVGSKGVVGKTAISGDYVQQSSGKLNIDADLKSGNADVLAVTGKATIAGVVNVNALTVSNWPVAVLTATGGVSVDPQLKQTDNSALFDFPVVASGNELDIQPTAHFNDAAASLDKNQKKMAAYLQALFDGGASLDDGFTALSKVSAGNGYAASLRSMSGEALGAFGAFRVNSSRAFANNLYQGCRELTFDRSTTNRARGHVFPEAPPTSPRAMTLLGITRMLTRSRSAAKLDSVTSWRWSALSAQSRASCTEMMALLRSRAVQPFSEWA